ncbi:MAG: hypothetical protein L3J71_14085 [Victivallaceae bacterium]|nr:hypothetical protein [Victivallaceae bacterium]
MEQFLPQTIKMVHDLGIINALYVLDSAHDAASNIDLFLAAEEYFLIKHNLRKESLEQWLANARRMGECNSPRPGNTVLRSKSY